VATPSSAVAGYNSIARKWTRHARLFSFNTMEARLIWNATLVTDELLDAQRELVDKRKMNIDVPSYEGTNFFVALYTDKDLGIFSLDKASNWEIALVGNDGQEVVPVKIEQVTLTVNEEIFYPHAPKWSKMYRVQFPATDLGREPMLIMRSIVGSSALKWKL